MRTKIFLLFCGLFLITACTRPSKTYIPTILPSASPSQTVAATSVPTMAAALPALLETATPGQSLPPTPFVSFTVHSAVDGMLFRTNPGTLFDAMLMLGPDDALTVLGSAPGNEWIKVVMEDETEGWVFRQLLESELDLTQLPILQTENAQVITGKVTDTAGSPIQGVAFNITTEGTTVVVVSDKNGDFYWFSPTDITGSWEISNSGIACESNVWSDETCATYKAGFTGLVEPTSRSIDLPYSGAPITFIFK